MTEQELKELHTREVYGQEEFDIRWGNREAYEFLGLIWEAYGDRHIVRNKETGEILSYFIPIGD